MGTLAHVNVLTHPPNKFHAAQTGISPFKNETMRQFTCK